MNKIKTFDDINCKNKSIEGGCNCNACSLCEYNANQQNDKFKEFNLSEKRKELVKYLKGSGVAEFVIENTINLIQEQDKELIRLLKEEIKYNVVEKESFISFTEEAFNRDIEKVINKLAGKKLNGI